MLPTAFVTHHDCSRHDTGWQHPEHQGRLPALARAVYRDMLVLHDRLLEVEARPAEEADLRRAHDAAYLQRVRRRVEEAAGEGRVLELEHGTRVSGASWEAAAAATGAALTACEAVLAGEARNAFCSVRPPGRGAGRGESREFALFNHVAVAALHLRERRGVERVLVVEWGAAAGRGTAEILAGRPGVRIASVHQAAPEAEPLPEEVAAAALPPGAGGAEAREALARVLERATDGFAPEFVLLSAGFDLLAGDPLGGLAVAPAEVHPLTALLRERAEGWCGGRLVSVLEGGYEPRLTGAAAVQHIRALAGLPPA